jgi:hypothetical protein
MRVVSTRLLAAVAVAASLALASTAWSHPQRMRAPHSAATASTRAKLQNPYSFGWIMGWWNDGSCHGYPDIMEVYVFYGDSATNCQHRNEIAQNHRRELHTGDHDPRG